MTDGKQPATPQGQAPPPGDGAGSGCHDPVDVVINAGWVVIDGCKVARAEPGGVIAFKDKCRRRSSGRGSDQVRVDVRQLAEAVEQATGQGEGDGV